MKLLIFTFFFILFTFVLFSDSFIELQDLMNIYGYEVTIEKTDRNLIIKANTYDSLFNEYINLTFFITASRAIIRFIETTGFDLTNYNKFIFMTGIFLREITISDFCEIIIMENGLKRKEELIKRSEGFIEGIDLEGAPIWQRHNLKNSLF